MHYKVNTLPFARALPALHEIPPNRADRELAMLAKQVPNVTY